MSVLYRAVRAGDLDGVFAIYDDEVKNGTSTFDTEPYDAARRRRWLEKHERPRYPAFVAEAPDGAITGWGTLSPYSDRQAYARTAETSVYVHRDHRRKGIGEAIVKLLLAEAKKLGYRVLIAKITTESAASMRLHARLGFEPVGVLRQVGEKFGRVLDVAILDLHLA